MMSWSDELLRDSPPQDLAAERHVLGCVLFVPTALEEVTGKLHASDFYHGGHGVIFEAVERLHGAGKLVDEISVASELQQMGKLEKAGGRAALAELGGLEATAAHLGYHAKVVAEKARARAVLHAAIRAIEDVRGGEDGYAAATQAAERMARLGATNGFGLATDLWKGMEVLQEPEVPPDWIVEPFFAKEDIVIVQADSGVGKTWCLLDMMLHAISGRELLGKFMCTPTRWLYCDFDMHPDGYIVKHRLKKLAKAVDTKFAEDWWIMTRKHMPGAINLTTGDGLNVLESVIREKRIEVAVLEVFGALHGADDENSSSQMEPVMNRLRDFTSRNHCAVILPHHTRKRQQGQQDDPASSGRGSTTIKNRSDCTIDLRVKRRQKDDDEEETSEKTIIVSHVKARYLKQLPDFAIQIEDDSLIGGVRVTYLGAPTRHSPAAQKVEKWLREDLWPQITSSGLKAAPQKDILTAAVEAGLCSEKTVRMAITQMQKTGAIKVVFKTIPGTAGRQKMLSLEGSGNGGKT